MAAIAVSRLADDKTGQSQDSVINDIAIARPPILIRAYAEGASDRTVAEMGHTVAAAFS